MVKTYIAKLEERQIEALKKISQETKIPEAELLGQAVELLLEKWQRERLEFLKRLDERLEEDKEALQRLAEL